MDSEHYTYRVTWSAEDNEFVGLCAEFPLLSWLDHDPVEAFRGIRQLVIEVITEMRASGETVPEALSDRRYSGKLAVRVPPALHRKLVIEAAEQGVSMNRLVSAKLAG